MRVIKRKGRPPKKGKALQYDDKGEISPGFGKEDAAADEEVDEESCGEEEKDTDDDDVDTDAFERADAEAKEEEGARVKAAVQKPKAGGKKVRTGSRA